MAGPLTGYASDGLSQEEKALRTLGFDDVRSGLEHPYTRSLLGRFLGFSDEKMKLEFLFSRLRLQKMLGDGFVIRFDGQDPLFVELISASRENAWSTTASLGVSKLHPETGFKGQLFGLVLQDGWVGIASWDAVKALVADGRELNRSNEDYYWISKDDMRSLKCHEFSL